MLAHLTLFVMLLAAAAILSLVDEVRQRTRAGRERWRAFAVLPPRGPFELPGFGIEAGGDRRGAAVRAVGDVNDANRGKLLLQRRTEHVSHVRQGHGGDGIEACGADAGAPRCAQFFSKLNRRSWARPGHKKSGRR
jgi:hypothetical protein